MNTFSLRSLLVALAVLLLTTASFAQNRRPAKSPARQEMHAYLQQTVMPVVRQQRQKLETQLSATDKTQLTAYRGQLQAMRKQDKQLRRSFRAANQPQQVQGQAKVTLTDAQKEQLKALRTQRRAILEQVKPLAQKYQAAISQLAAEVQPQQVQWQTDMQAIRAKYPAATPENAPAKAGRKHSGQRRYFQPVSFLLLNPNAPTHSRHDKQQPAVGDEASVYPNPVAATSQLTYEVKKAGPVTVELLDGRGSALRTVVNQKQNKGTYSQAVQVDDLARGTYFFKITTRSGVETKRFVKQ
ncbi:hypothetical protein PK28_06420 [Hymenobacter sp. DG25B]|uniref:T9SS type A sorting domain-containing protein n=1 Tax=Hymenobacter sp. DG25B TaxID=1385664 RepID=UPI0005412326|nr:T9SS type A sorting domain-containing protein [Hymenobacter sp. DG25B]AIZ63416.1 hypothetical protein PK28_06420 [Hymenobacter sp. DG25B]